MRDRSSIWIGIADLLLCVLCVVITAVAPIKSKQDGVKPHAEYLIQLFYDVRRDIDIDLWVVGPTHKPVFYGSRQVGCLDLDRDTLGLSSSLHQLADGSIVQDKDNVETVSVRCFEPGHYDVGVNLYSWHSDTAHTIDSRVEITGLNPSVRTVWAGVNTLDGLGTTNNIVSFDLDKDGNMTLTSVPLEPITHPYARPITGAPPP